MEKQIEEMAVENLVAFLWHNTAMYDEDLIFDVAEAIVNEGYRKQIVAEWKAGNENGQYGYYCSNCKAGFTGENAEWIAKEHDFCPKCGAMMKGEQQ